MYKYVWQILPISIHITYKSILQAEEMYISHKPISTKQLHIRMCILYIVYRLGYICKLNKILLSQQHFAYIIIQYQ